LFFIGKHTLAYYNVSDVVVNAAIEGLAPLVTTIATKLCWIDPLPFHIVYVRIPPCNQGCQIVSFQTKNPNLGKFWRALDWKLLIYFMVIWNILHTFGIFYHHLLHVVFMWYIFSGLGNIYKEKSGNPALQFWPEQMNRCYGEHNSQH
jgi:hypothetical protein